MSDERIFEAIKAGDAGAIREILGHDPQLAAARNAQGVSAILLARYYGRTEIAELLENSGVDLDVFEAAAAGRVERVREAVEADASLANAFAPDGFTPLGLAAFFGQEAVVACLLDHGAEVNAVSRNATGYTALTAAVARGHVVLVAQLLACGADASHRYGPGHTPLHTAAASGHREVARMLIEYGADPGAKTDEGRTAGELAAEKGHAELATWLTSREP